MTINALNEMIYPFYGSAALAGAVFISLFFALSSRKGFKVFIVTLALLAISTSIFLNIYYLRVTENFSDYLFKFGFLQSAEVIVILFAALNILIFISIRNFSDRNLIKIIVVLLFSLICLDVFVVANNFLMIFVSLVLFLLCVFQMLALLDSKSGSDLTSRYSLKNYIIRFLLVGVFSLLLIFAGFSLVFGATDFKNFTQIIQSEKIGSPIIVSGILLVFFSIYFYLFIFPFQNAYLKLGRRCEGSSLLIIWFLYFPAGFFLLLKVYEVLVYFMEKDNRAVSTVFIIISALCILGGNIGAIRTKSMRRIFLFLFLSMTGMSALALAQKSLGLLENGRVLWIIIANMAAGMLFYFPAFAIFYEVEKYAGSDMLGNIRGFFRTHRFFGINLMILLLSFAGMIGTAGYFTKVFYFQPYFGFFGSGGDAVNYSSSSNLIIISGIIAAAGVLFMAANILRLIVHLLLKPDKNVEIRQLPKFYYPYVLVFTLLTLGIGISGILGFDLINIF